MARILVYEADEAIAHKICLALQREKHTVLRCDESAPCPGQDETLPTLAVLDARMKWSACRPLFTAFQEAGWPVLFLTADREMTAHLRALYRGSSDVLMLPFTQKLIAAKVVGLLGHAQPLRELTVDEAERVALLGGQRVELTAQEFALLLALMEEPDTPVSREQLLRKAWGYQSMGETRTVDVHVQRLRKKLGGERIETVYKCGYRLKMA
ncbi:MAG: response regulator transcription factor [Eubacteriales bacterium]|nr:response regulator transcription factor [Eubacteriales bacterium]